MLHSSKVVWKDNAALVDLSLRLSDIHSDAVPFAFVAAQDKLYLGSDFAFNHRFIDVKRANTAAAVISQIETWSGNSWDAVAQIFDDTQAGGKSFGKSGVVGWVPERHASWAREGSTEDIPELSTLKIYDKKWVRITFSADLADCELNYVGHRFSSDADLRARYPDLMNPESLDAFEQGKTGWNVQHVLAAEELIRDMKRDLDIWSENQILDWQLFQDAACHKVATYAFTAFGRDYVDNLDTAEAAYAKARNKKIFNIDKNANAILRPAEKIASVGFRRA